MLLRLIVIGAAICLIAAFLGKRRLALALLAGLGVAAVALWVYESYLISSQGELFAENEVVFASVELVPSNYRPNLFELKGTVTNNSEQATLDGALLNLELQDCTQADACRALPDRQQFVATKLPPQSEANFLEKIYLDQASLPHGKIKIEYNVESLRGHRPVWR